MFVRAPENDLNYGADVTLAVQEMEDRFSEASTRAPSVPCSTTAPTIAAHS
jgi:hypothetical protein